MRNLSFVLLVIFALGCSEPPSAPPVDTYTLETPPPKGGTLEGVYANSDGFRISNSGLYDSGYGEWYATDLRVSGKSVWFRATGEAYVILFSGSNEGNRIQGTIRTDYYSASQGIIEIGAPRPYTFTRVP